jgi:hypothetical protein
MSRAAHSDEDLFDGGPPLRWQRSLGLVRPGDSRSVRRAQLVMLVGWVPPALLAAVQAFAMRDEAAKSFFYDFAVYARFLVAAPLLILAEPDCIPRLGGIARHFLDAGLVREPDTARFAAAVASTRRLLDSTTADFVAVLIAYVLVVALIVNAAPGEVPAWYVAGGAGHMAFSPAGWWHTLVSLPLLLVLFIGWLWRVLLWGRFLWLMARFDLLLIPSHPDHVGGLKFVGSSLRGFRLLGLALGAIAAGTAANRAVYQGASPLAFKHVAVGLVVFVLVLSAGPLTVFVRKLRAAKRRGTFEYGALGCALGRQFEQKWLGRAGGVDESALDAPDFSATTDLYQVVSNVYEMNSLPFDLKSLGEPVVATLLPFVPVALMAVPLDVVIESIAKLLL